LKGDFYSANNSTGMLNPQNHNNIIAKEPPPLHNQTYPTVYIRATHSMTAP